MKQLNKLTELKEEAKNTTLVEREYNLEEDEEPSEDEERKQTNEQSNGRTVLH